MMDFWSLILLTLEDLISSKKLPSLQAISSSKVMPSVPSVLLRREGSAVSEDLTRYCPSWLLQKLLIHRLNKSRDKIPPWGELVPAVIGKVSLTSTSCSLLTRK